MKPKIQRRIWASGKAGSGHSNTGTRDLQSCSISQLSFPCILRQSLWEYQNYIPPVKSRSRQKLSFPNSTKKLQSGDLVFVLALGNSFFFFPSECVAAAKGYDTVARGWHLQSWGVRLAPPTSHIWKCGIKAFPGKSSYQSQEKQMPSKQKTQLTPTGHRYQNHSPWKAQVI